MKELLKTASATLATALVLITLWVVATRPGAVPAHILPPPEGVAAALWQGMTGNALWPHALYTIKSASLGLVLGTGSAVLLASLSVLVPAVGAFFTPLVMASQSIPKVAIAPILIGYIGFGIGAKVLTVAVLCFSPMFVAMVSGMNALDARLVDLYRAASASKLHILVHARIPSAAPYFFATLQVSVVLALVGSVVSEFVASSQWLGFVLKARAEDVNLSMMFATIVVLSLIGAIGGSMVKTLHRRIVFWR